MHLGGTLEYQFATVSRKMMRDFARAALLPLDKAMTAL
jgi:hypothetical protein